VCEEFPEFLYLPLLPLYKLSHGPLARLIPIQHLSGPLNDLPHPLVLCWRHICIRSYVEVFYGGPAKYEIEWLLLLLQVALNVFQRGTRRCLYGTWDVSRGGSQGDAGGHWWLMRGGGRGEKASLSGA
jgi:hypothetical protein